MKILHEPRGGGKTTEIVKESALTGARIVCYSHNQVHEVLNTAKHLRLDIPTPLHMETVFNNSFRFKTPHRRRLIFDNVDLILEYLTGCKIHAITVTKNNKS